VLISGSWGPGSVLQELGPGPFISSLSMFSSRKKPRLKTAAFPAVTKTGKK
jgi:hypothetical protein